ncbi:MAG TPA: serine hydrolase domain-containing protein [Micromonosporaceae bacterium]
MTPTKLDPLREAMAARIAAGGLPGMVLLVARGTDVHAVALGTMAFDSDQPMPRDALFRLGSMTKPILAAATMVLAEEGALNLTEPVDRLLPELAGRRVLRRIDGPLDDTVAAQRPITVLDLLTCRMGYGMVFEPTVEPPYPVINAANELGLVMGPPDPPTTHHPDEWIRRFATLPLMDQPGQRWRYNAGALVLSVLLARAAGQPLAEVFQTRLFEPLGMTSTGFTVPADQTHRLPAYYLTNFATMRLERQTLSPPDQWATPPAFPSGAGGLVSTIDDYLSFARLLLNQGVHKGTRLLSADSVRLMTSNQIAQAQIAEGGPLLAGRGWGLGLAVTTGPDDISAPGRYGWDGGYGTSWFNDPSRNLVAIAMSQTADILFNGTTAQFARLAVLD